MKRFFILFSCISILVLAGCGSNSSNGNKTLECSSTGPVGIASSEQNYKIYFDNESVVKLSIDINVTLNEQDDITRDNLENDVSNAFDVYKNRDGVSYSSNVKDNGFNVRLDVNFNKLSDEDKASISLINSEKSYDEIKNEFESDGFSCK